MPTRVVVTGGAGFIGSHVGRALLDRGCRVTVIDHYSHYSPDEEAARRAWAYRRDYLLPGAEILRVDVRDSAALSAAVRDAGPTHLIHLAGTPLATAARADPGGARDSILIGASNVMEAAARIRALRQVVFVSSSMAYGHFTSEPLDEDAPMRPIELYGGLKLAAEDLVRCYGRLHRIPTTIVRPTSVYGPTDVNGRVIQRLLDGARSGAPVEVSNPESTFLDFSYVTDVAAGIALAALRSEGPDCRYNISYGQARSLADVVAILTRLHPLAQFTPVRDADFRPRRGALDITRARTDLGYTPTVDLSEGLRRYDAFLADRHPISQTVR